MISNFAYATFHWSLRCHLLKHIYGMQLIVYTPLEAWYLEQAELLDY